jgi:hypothetical protein
VLKTARVGDEGAVVVELWKNKGLCAQTKLVGIVR